jgi:tetratricopeptide (TPR) repeat protein
MEDMIFAISEKISEAELLISYKRYREAVDILVKLKKKLKNLGPEANETLTDAIVLLGSAYYELGRMNEARHCYEEAIKRTKEIDCKKKLADWIAGHEDIDDFEVIDEETILLSMEQSIQLMVAGYKNEFSMVLWAEKKLDKAIELCENAADIMLEGNEEIPEVFQNLAIFYMEKKEFKKAREILEILKESCEARHDIQGLGKALNELGIVNGLLGNVEQAVASFCKSILLKHRIGDWEGIHMALFNLQKCFSTHKETFSNPAISKIFSDSEIKQIFDRIYEET